MTLLESLIKSNTRETIENSIDEHVEKWHCSEEAEHTFCEYMGFTLEQYTEFLIRPDKLFDDLYMKEIK